MVSASDSAEEEMFSVVFPLAIRLDLACTMVGVLPDSSVDPDKDLLTISAGVNGF